MPFDGVATKCIINELNEKLIGARIQNIYMPEKDEVIFTLRNLGTNYKLVVSVNPSCSRIHLTTYKKTNPKKPPNFCMFLRKHISSGKIIAINFHDYERIVDIIIESYNDLGDMQQKRIIIELTGRNCNLIITNSNNIVLDALKHIDEDISSKRQIMPAREYVLPPTQNKISPKDFKMEMLEKYKTRKLDDALLAVIKGFSPVICREICFRANIDTDTSYEKLSLAKRKLLASEIKNIIDIILNNEFSPCIVIENSKPKDYYPISLTQYKTIININSFNETLEQYFVQKDTIERINQKQGNIRRIINKNIERCQKKINIHEKNINSQSKLDKYKN